MSHICGSGVFFCHWLGQGKSMTKLICCEFLLLWKNSSDRILIDFIGEKKEVKVNTCSEKRSLNWQVLLEIILLHLVHVVMTAL